MDTEKYVCEICNKIFKFHSLYVKHKNNKKSCNIEIIVYKCEIRNKPFKFNSLYLKHKNNKKSCQPIIKDNNIQENIIIEPINNENNNQEIIIQNIINEPFIKEDNIKDDDNKEIIINKQIYNCELCNTEFKFKSLYEIHKNRKTSCVNNDKNINEDNQDLEEINRKYANITQLISNKNKKSVIDKCYFCNKEFSTKGNLTKHKNNNCKVHKDLISQQQKYRELINKFKNNTEIANLKE
jgi:hypothetical protein